MDRATNSTAPADRLFCAVELSKKSWLLGIQFPDRQKASIYPLKGGDSEGLMAKLVAACDRWTKVTSARCSRLLLLIGKDAVAHGPVLRNSARVGSSIWKVDPLPSVDSTQMRPPCISTICFAM